MLWNICFKEYDRNGYLISLIPCKCARIKMKFRAIKSFLGACPTGNVREVQFRRASKNYPSIVSDGNSSKWSAPVLAKLPLFEYCKRAAVA